VDVRQVFQGEGSLVSRRLSGFVRDLNDNGKGGENSPPFLFFGSSLSVEKQLPHCKKQFLIQAQNGKEYYPEVARNARKT
jgi:hypothetical protein